MITTRNLRRDEIDRVSHDESGSYSACLRHRQTGTPGVEPLIAFSG
ncbi:MAG TPA: hypothetical protein VKY19_04670 [Ktedonosporobacter sp.]|jgi:hypothetical protein|nr:hypothetical protein [Ktedonosporobacter sp.]